MKPLLRKQYPIRLIEQFSWPRVPRPKVEIGTGSTWICITCPGQKAIPNLFLLEGQDRRGHFGDCDDRISLLNIFYNSDLARNGCTPRIRRLPPDMGVDQNWRDVLWLCTPFFIWSKWKGKVGEKFSWDVACIFRGSRDTTSVWKQGPIRNQKEWGARSFCGTRDTIFIADLSIPDYSPSFM